MPEIVFVPTDGVGKPTAENRKLIRSHCMLGKNKKKRMIKTKAGDHVGMTGQESRTSAVVSNVAGMADVYPRRGRATQETWESAATEYTLSLSVGTPWTFSLLSFAREIDRWSQELLFKCVPCPPRVCHHCSPD